MLREVRDHVNSLTKVIELRAQVAAEGGRGYCVLDGWKMNLAVAMDVKGIWRNFWRFRPGRQDHRKEDISG